MSLDYQAAIGNIRNILENHITKSDLRCLVIGESGGIDSALCTILAKPVCDKLCIPLIARSITIESNKEDEISRAYFMGTLFTTDFKELNLTDLYYAMRDELITLNDIITIPESFQSGDNKSFNYKIACGNLKARIRMIKLYALAGINKGMVLSTDNYTEYLAGFWTLHGDQGDFGMIQNLWKTEVYKMAEYIANNEYADDLSRRIAITNCINAVPTDGLGISNSDLEQLGVDSYEEADAIFQTYQGGNVTKNDRSALNKHPLIQRFMATEHKRNNPYNIPRADIFTLAA